MRREVYRIIVAFYGASVYSGSRPDSTASIRGDRGGSRDRGGEQRQGRERRAETVRVFRCACRLPAFLRIRAMTVLRCDARSIGNHVSLLS